MARKPPRARLLLHSLLLVAGAAWCCQELRAFVLPSSPGAAPRAAHGGGSGGRARLRAEVVDVQVAGEETEGSLALMKLEKALQAQIAEAKAGDNPDRLRDMARLLVLAKTAEGIAASEITKDASNALQQAVADSLSAFVGKKDYDFQDVTQEINNRFKKVSDKLENLYLDDIAREMDLASQAAIASFTGKEEYQFGDITKEVGVRAKSAVADFTGKKEYQFGDITKAAMQKGGDAIKQFTGKEEYQFGDISKTVFKKLFG